MSSKNDFSWLTVIITAAFCLAAAFGGGFTLQELAPKIGGWAAIGYALIGAIFIAAGAVIIQQVVATFQDA